MTTISSYEQQAIDFANKYGVTLTIGKSFFRKHFPGDIECRWVFNCCLYRDGKKYYFDFGQSIAAGNNPPTMYDILACLTKYDPGTFEDFCSDFGYEMAADNEEVYDGVHEEWNGVEALFSDILYELREIQ